MSTTITGHEYEFSVAMVTQNDVFGFELTVFRDGKLDQDPRWFETIDEVTKWIGFTLEWASA